MISNLHPALNELLRMGEKRGWLSYEELNNTLPDEWVDPTRVDELLVLIDRGTSDEDLRLPMDGAVVRMQRVLRSLGSEQAEPVGQREDLPAPLPQRQVHNPQHGERASRE